ncbi:MAG: uncharacterized protein JWM68_5635 [Verrucomicrobiales bacterium]|nr:uncharacterized protein [Verrucomicrobiales bacterium]
MKHKLILTNVLSLALAVGFVGCSTGTGTKRSTGQYIDDKGTAQRVRTNLNKDSLVKATKIHVESFRGNVHLTGFVDYPAQKQHAEEIARNTEGVEWIKDDIIVKSELPNTPTSSQISEPSGARAGGSVSTQSSRSTQFQGGTAAGASGSSSGWVRGNRGMNTELFPGEVQGEAAGAQSQSSQGFRSSGTSSSSTFNQSATQGELSQRVKSELQSDTTLSAQNIQVQQDGDKIILRGTVSSKEQKEALEAKAKAIPGVRSVSNKLDVQK